jgi:hypothetical protein
VTDEITQRYAMLRADLTAFGPQCLKIRTKAGTFPNLSFNAAQLEVHRRLEEQKEATGRVRALVLKGRQMGISTYIAARYYHRTSMWRGRNTYILTHEQAASDTLFGMVDRFQKDNPFAPHVGTSNIKELEFDKLDSSYAVATAGGKAGGRSKALSYFHGSEVAFWPNAGDHFAASVQAVPEHDDTEIILESTSAGAGGEFYERCQDADAGLSDYILIFLPWWMATEYRRDPPPGFELSSEHEEGEMSEEEYSDLHKLGRPQMAWRRAKIIELRDPLLFRREYPATVDDAWTAPPGHEPYISALDVLRARKRKVAGHGPLVIGVDPASGGGDRFAMCGRRGLRVEWVRFRNKLNHEEAVQWVRDAIDKERPARVNIDAGNIGANVVTSLKNIGPQYGQVVRGVNFGGTSEWRLARPKVPGPFNRRAEMWQRMKEWLELAEGVSLPDDGALQADITAPKQKPRLDNFTQLESKVEMRARGIRSPDLADAVALTFAFREYFTAWHEPAAAVSYGDIDAQLPQLPDDIADSEYGDIGGQHSWMG